MFVHIIVLTVMILMTWHIKFEARNVKNLNTFDEQNLNGQSALWSSAYSIIKFSIVFLRNEAPPIEFIHDSNYRSMFYTWRACVGLQNLVQSLSCYLYSALILATVQSQFTVIPIWLSEVKFILISISCNKSSFH